MFRCYTHTTTNKNQYYKYHYHHRLITGSRHRTTSLLIIYYLSYAVVPRCCRLVVGGQFVVYDVTLDVTSLRIRWKYESVQT